MSSEAGNGACLDESLELGTVRWHPADVHDFETDSPNLLGCPWAVIVDKVEYDPFVLVHSRIQIFASDLFFREWDRGLRYDNIVERGAVSELLS